MDDCAGLENRYTSGYRGFESHSLRHNLNTPDLKTPIFCLSYIYNSPLVVPLSIRWCCAVPYELQKYVRLGLA